MTAPASLTGQRFGRLVVVESAVRSCGCLKRDHHRRICGGVFRGGA